MLSTSGRCCSGLLQYGDYCVNSYIYTTVAATGGTKFFYCDRDSSNNCNPSNSYTIYMSDDINSVSPTISTYKTCTYTFSTTDIAASKDVDTQVENYMNSLGQVYINSATATDTTLKIYLIDKDQKATLYKLKDVIDVNVLSVLVIISISGSSQLYTITYGNDVYKALYGVSRGGTTYASMLITNIACIIILISLILIQ
ncbi:UNKNOWN [Stylonychia lemnae]|uniref:Uncharacterized protein n=1 Tax=Stylonychia lemnae TaxID=5949 RepID=A0A078A7C5_STYLE|nr:UNKNOWN [Stylonychia lemnae]|eukprot:CDW78149.1 UNKNOWN [Stylonychia lemnae]